MRNVLAGLSGALLTGALLAAPAFADERGVQEEAKHRHPKPTPLTCAQLAGMAITASEIKLPTTGGTVTSATVAAASGSGAGALPEHCLV